MDKVIRDWSVYVYIEDLIKTMMTSLRALSELQNPAMKERHWSELMNVTNVILFTFDINLMYLYYYNYFRSGFLLRNRQH